MKTICVTESFISQKSSYDRFAKLQNEILDFKGSIKIVLDIKNRLGFTFVFLAACIPFLTSDEKVTINCNEKCFSLFKKINVIPNCVEYSPDEDYAPYLLDKTSRITEDEDIFKTVTEITKEAPVEMSSELSAIFISKAGEMFNNALEHSQGIVLGCKYFKNQKNTYCFSCYDTGVGIPNKVMKVNSKISTSLDAFKWAMVDGNSTAGDDIPRGLGLGLLKSFAKANDGIIRICSGNILYIFGCKDGEKYYELNNSFVGTLFEMDIIADNDHKYILK